MCEGGWRAKVSFPMGVGVRQGCVTLPWMDV